MEQVRNAATHYTIEEYMALEATSEVRHEFYRGEISAMAGATSIHNLIVLNCAFGLRSVFGW